MRLAWSLVGLSFSATLCASVRAQTTPPATPGSYDEQAVGVRSLGSANREAPLSGERPGWLYAEGKWDAFRGPDHHPISEEALYRIVGREDLLFRYQNKAAIKTAITVSSGALVLGGLIFAAVADLPNPGQAVASTYPYTRARAPAVPPPNTPMWAQAGVWRSPAPACWGSS